MLFLLAAAVTIPLGLDLYLPVPGEILSRPKRSSWGGGCFSPAGYQNVDGPHGKRIITPHPTEAPIITELYTLFATGNYSLKSLVHYTRERGMILRGNKLQLSTLHQILRKRNLQRHLRLRCITYNGTHDPLTTKETWDSVQRILDARKEHHAKAVCREFPFTGVVTCGHCGCAMVAELKKHKYVYYHCTGHRGKCPEPYTRQETLINDFASILGELVIPEPILEWLAQELTKTDQTEQGARETTIQRYEQERARIQHRLTTLYDDRLDGTINKPAYEEKARLLQAQRDEIERNLATTTDAARIPLTTALDLARLTSNAWNNFREQNEAEQRKLLMMILKEAAWKDGGLRTTLLEPFEQLRCSNRPSHTKINGDGGAGRDLKIWLPKNRAFQLFLHFPESRAGTRNHGFQPDVWTGVPRWRELAKPGYAGPWVAGR